MIRKFLITYRAVSKHHTVVMDAFSKYDAKKRFYRTYPKYEVVSIVEVSEDDH